MFKGHNALYHQFLKLQAATEARYRTCLFHFDIFLSNDRYIDNGVGLAFFHDYLTKFFTHISKNLHRYSNYLSVSVLKIMIDFEFVLKN